MPMPVIMNILRDKRLTTEILILLELVRNHHHKFKTIADSFDMTVQAVSDYFKIMKREGLVHKVKGEYRPTQKGILFLHSNFSGIREFIDRQMRTLNIIDLCTAVAGTRIRPGDRVGLFMEDGELRAYKDRSSTSMGLATTGAGTGEAVGVKELEGIVEMSLGELRMVQVPSITEPSSGQPDPEGAREAIRDFAPDRIGSAGTMARILLRTIDVDPDIEFAVSEACLEACQKGLDVLVFAEERGVYELTNSINEFNLSSEEKIRFEVESLSTGEGRGVDRKRSGRRVSGSKKKGGGKKASGRKRSRGKRGKKAG